MMIQIKDMILFFFQKKYGRKLSPLGLKLALKEA